MSHPKKSPKKPPKQGGPKRSDNTAAKSAKPAAQPGPANQHRDDFWNIRLLTAQEALEKGNFICHIVSDLAEARKLVLETIIPSHQPESASWGGSMTFKESGLVEAIKGLGTIKVLDTYDTSLPNEQRLEMRRQALLVDMFFTGSNAVTEDGALVNLDMIGNRVGALAFGPKKVVVLAGRNKVVAGLDEAMFRIKEYAAPANAMKLNKKTPCLKTSHCQDCSSEDRICNTWVINEKSWPKARIEVILINQDLGL
ncbi:MAG: lactate utilization protein [Desulfovibrio sp.]|mgnify:CR=1 FL=1|nr:MAG: lactate utilization protein [Desulfovibrio sp.]